MIKIPEFHYENAKRMKELGMKMGLTPDEVGELQGLSLTAGVTLTKQYESKNETRQP